MTLHVLGHKKMSHMFKHIHELDTPLEKRYNPSTHLIQNTILLSLHLWCFVRPLIISASAFGASVPCLQGLSLRSQGHQGRSRSDCAGMSSGPGLVV